MNDRAHVSYRHVIDDAVLAGFDIHFDLGEAGDVGMGCSVAWSGVLCYCEQTLPGESLSRSNSEGVDALRNFVAVVDAPHFDGSLGCLRERHAGTAALARNALMRHFIILGLAAELLSGNFLK